VAPHNGGTVTDHTRVITRFLKSADFPATGAVVGQLVGAGHDQIISL
jgi:hypothetical protein